MFVRNNSWIKFSFSAFTIPEHFTLQLISLNFYQFPWRLLGRSFNDQKNENATVASLEETHWNINKTKFLQRNQNRNKLAHQRNLFFFHDFNRQKSTSVSNKKTAGRLLSGYQSTSSSFCAQPDKSNKAWPNLYICFAKAIQMINNLIHQHFSNHLNALEATTHQCQSLSKTTQRIIT